MPALRGALTRFVAGHRVASRSAPHRAYVRLPDGAVDLVVRVGDRGAEVLAGGTRLHAFRKIIDDTPESLVVHFRPGGAYPFFGVPLSELTDRFVSIERLWGTAGADLTGRIADAPDAAARLRLVERALVERLRGGALFEPASAARVRRAIDRVVASPVLPRVDQLARDVGMSARQLRRGFEAVVGMGPKAFVRVVRFQRALGLAGTRDWSAVAAAAGYYDQAHLIADFRDLAGATPSALRRAMP
jgi:AraC-like DNA-binding protein